MQVTDTQSGSFPCKIQFAFLHLWFSHHIQFVGCHESQTIVDFKQERTHFLTLLCNSTQHSKVISTKLATKELMRPTVLWLDIHFHQWEPGMVHECGSFFQPQKPRCLQNVYSIPLLTHLPAQTNLTTEGTKNTQVKEIFFSFGRKLLVVPPALGPNSGSMLLTKKWSVPGRCDNGKLFVGQK